MPDIGLIALHVQTDIIIYFHTIHQQPHHHFDGLVQERRNSSALALELRLSCTNPLILYSLHFLYKFTDIMN